MAGIDSEWKMRKKWSTMLSLNIGVHEGREWVGNVSSSDQLVALGDTVATAGRLSDFGRHGALWTSKHVISLLPAEVQKKLVFGIRRSGPGDEIFLSETFSRVMDLIDLNKPENAEFVPIGMLSVAEVLECDPKLSEEAC